MRGKEGREGKKEERITGGKGVEREHRSEEEKKGTEGRKRLPARQVLAPRLCELLLIQDSGIPHMPLPLSSRVSE